MHLSPTSKLGYLSFENAFGSPTRMQDKNIFRCTRALCCEFVVLNAFANSVHTLNIYSSHRRCTKTHLAIQESLID